MADRLDWEVDGRDWPHRDASRFVDAAGLRWHVQRWGPPAAEAPVLLLLHGTGAATHSWRALAPLLAERLHVVACDLPGHGFTAMPPDWQLTLPGMALAVGTLVAALRLDPALVVGHSAGAAVGARLCLDGHLAPAALVALNGAFLPLGGLAGTLFAPAARLMSALPFVPRWFAARARDPAVVRDLLDGTGSKLDDEGVAYYARLMRSPGHAAGALGMMANWDLDALARDLPGLATPLLLVVGGQDRTIPPAQATRVQALLPRAERIDLPGLGHLAHEERPERVAELLGRVARQHGVLD